jgi:RNA polymerase sigma-70 factor (ECF subfamily)
MRAGRLVPLEQQLTELLAASDLRAAATAAVRGYGPELVGYLRAVLRDPTDADEVFSRVCEKLWNGIGRFRGDSSLRTWLYRLSFNAARDFQKVRGRNRFRRLETSEASVLALEVLSSQPAAPADEALDRLRRTLDPEEQTLLTLRIHTGLSWREVGKVLGEPGRPVDEAAMRKRFERVKLKLRDLARAEGLIR